MDGYTFDEGVAFLVLVKAPLGVINHLKATHNRSHLHSEIHKQLRFPRVKEILHRNMPTPKGSDDNNRRLQPTESNDTESRSPEVSRPESDDDETDPTEIILTKEDVRTHENTRLEDMPNDLCRTLWQKRQDVWRELQQAHMKMRAVPVGEEHNEERAKWRAEVLRLDAENDNYWKQIDAEIERFKEEKERADKKANKTPDFDISTYRAYISKALRKKQLTPAQLAELQHRVDAMIAANVELKPETIEKLKAIGIHA